MTQQLTLPFWLIPQVAPQDNVRRETPSQSTENRIVPAVDVATALAAFIRVFRRMELKRPLPEFRVEYRPYAGLRSTICLRGNRVNVQISDVLAESPLIVLEALAEILLAKLFRRRASREARDCYLAYVFRESTRSRIEEVRRTRGYKRQRPARGRYFDLLEIFTELNSRFFQGQVVAPSLGWSTNRSRTILGHYDSAHHSITISRWLDSPSVPRYLVEYIMFHEMLHLRHPVDHNGVRRRVHTEQDFDYFL